MLASEVIRVKRDGRELTPQAIADLVADYARGQVPDYQMAAFCMAVFFRGLSTDELRALTSAMLHSGDVLDLSQIPGRKVDKHSTGGVGDKVSLALAPLAAACGVKVPMVAGRGLGHTGGTVDKLEAIPGFQVDLAPERFREVLASTGACIVGQTARIAPADRKLYALRDLTGTVESIPLIAASILSKKLAEGIDALVLDVKVGSGAFMKRTEDARRLAETIAAVGRSMGTAVTAFLTDMDQPLGRAVGNALEVREAVELLQDEGPRDLRDVTVELTAEMVLLAGLAGSRDEARGRVVAAIGDGRGFLKLCEIVEAQGGDPDALADPSLLPAAEVTRDVAAVEGGVVQAIDAEAIGLASLCLGAGRARLEDKVDPVAGLVVRKKIGDPVEPGEPLVTLHVGKAPHEPPEAVEARVRAAYQVGSQPVPAERLVRERIEGGGPA
ncbi:MAG TPA: thymidine phosphorylase [Anaeromyxobacteraceae bacterium]|nr:thymidine phosphorylase [Anaeromyxobacteraceae bacterium]